MGRLVWSGTERRLGAALAPWHAKPTIAGAPPSDPSPGLMWREPTTGDTAIWLGGRWQAYSPNDGPNAAELIGNATLCLTAEGHDGTSTWLNRGLGGSALDGLIGGANGAPRWLDHAGTNYVATVPVDGHLRLDGTTNTHAQTADIPQLGYGAYSTLATVGQATSVATTPASSINPTSFTIIIHATARDWTPSTPRTFASKRMGALLGGWRLTNSTSGGLSLQISDGTNSPTLFVNPALFGLVDGQGYWFEVYYNDSAKTARFRMSSDPAWTPVDEISWSTVGTSSAHSDGSPAAISTPITLGAFSSTSSDAFNGAISRFVLMSGAPDTGTVLASPDFTLATPGASSITDGQGNTWTVGPLAAITPANGTFMRTTGTATSYASCPHATALGITGDLDLRLHLAMDDWTPASNARLAAKYSTSSDRSWFLSIGTTGNLEFGISTDGSTFLSRVATAAVGFTDGQPGWLRVTLDVDNGAGGHDVRFYKSSDGASWTQIGSTVTNTGTITLHAGSSSLFVGKGGDNTGPATARFLACELLNGIAGTVVASARFNAQMPGATSFTDSAANVWTLGAGASIQPVGAKTVRVEVDVAPDTWAPSTARSFMSQWGNTTGTRAFNFRTSTTATLAMQTAADGFNPEPVIFSPAHTLPAANRAWVAAAWQADNGSGSRRAEFQTSADGTSWTTLGGTYFLSSPAAKWGLYNSGAPVRLGSSGETNSYMQGRIYRARLWADDRLIASPDFTRVAAGTTSVTDAQGNVWTLSGNATIVPPSSGVYAAADGAWRPTASLDVRTVVALDDWTPAAPTPLVAHWGDQRCWQLEVAKGGELALLLSGDGTTHTTITADDPVEVDDGGLIAVRAAWSSTGAVAFYAKPVENPADAYAAAAAGTGWTQIGETINTGVPASLAAITAPLYLVADCRAHGADNRSSPRATYATVVNVNGVTVAAVGPQDITSGAATSITPTVGPSLTVDRTSHGPKLTLVTRPTMLFGSVGFGFSGPQIDQVVVTDADGVLDPGAGSMSVAAAVRIWPQAVDTGRIVSKSGGVAMTGGVGGWYLATAGTSIAPRFRVADGAIGSTRDGGTFTEGDVVLLGGVLNRSNQTIVAGVNGTLGSTGSTSAIGSVTNDRDPVVVGGQSAYPAFECFAVLAWKGRAPTASELGRVGQALGS